MSLIFGGLDDRYGDACIRCDSPEQQLEQAVIKAAIDWANEPDNPDARERRATPAENTLWDAVDKLSQARTPNKETPTK